MNSLNLKKIGTGIATLLIAVSCANEDILVPDNNEAANPEEKTFKVSEEEAKERLAFVMNQLEPVVTYGSSGRTIKDVHAWRLDKQNIATYSSAGEDYFDFSDIDTLLYIINFENHKGFALVSADNRTTPVLAITDDGVMTADDIKNVDNPGFIAFMNNAVWLLLNEIATNDEPITTYAHTAIEQPNMIETRNTVLSYPARLKTKWGQGHPYNMYCPIVSNTLTVTGCVPTAGAQALSFFQTINSVSWSDTRYPNSPQSGSSVLNWNTIISDCEQWDWAVANERWRHVPHYYVNNTYGYGRLGVGRATTTQVAQLMRYVGARIGANYRVDPITGPSTGAVVFTLLWFLKTDCGLTSSSDDLYGFDTDNVFEALKNKNALILVRSSNHAWLIDGGQEILYSGNDRKKYMHCNYGWDSYCDGYYYADVFDVVNGPVFTDTGIELGGARPNVTLTSLYYAVLSK